MDRWVASRALYRFQLPAANGSREACEPRADPASLITKCGLKKDLSRTPQGTLIQIRDSEFFNIPEVLFFLWSFVSGSCFQGLHILTIEKGFHKQIIDGFEFFIRIQGREQVLAVFMDDLQRSEERRVGKECL